VALVETDKGILMVREKGHKDFSLPGGGANKGESRKDAAMRELQEETGNTPISAEYLYSYKANPFTGYRGDRIQNDVKVFVVTAEGTPRIRNKWEIQEIAWWTDGYDLPFCRGVRRTLEADWKSLKNM
jgi:ADP-ribose pyrophosphatase YjhB (NUDIX family)